MSLLPRAATLALAAGAAATAAVASYALSNPSTANLCKPTSEDKTVTLADGRKLGYSDRGSGWPVIYFPCDPGSRLSFPPNIDEICAELKIRFIVLERPSSGLSSPTRDERTYRSFAADVNEFAEILHIDKFSLVGHSGGAMHAMAAAAFLRDKVAKLAVLGAAVDLRKLKTPRTDFDFFGALAKHMQANVNLVSKSPLWLTKFAFWSVSSSLANPAKFASEILTHPGEISAFGGDEVMVARFREYLERNIAEFFRQGVRPMIDDMRAFCVKGWDFDLQEIQQETNVFVGALDDYSPVLHSEYIAKMIPNAKLTIFPNDGHYSIYWTQTKQILQSVLPR